MANDKQEAKRFYLDGFWIYDEELPLSESQSDWEHWL